MRVGRKGFHTYKSRKGMFSENGSAQVVEMSFVLPMAMGVVMTLIYLAFAMFLYVHLQGIAEVAADRITNAVVSNTSSGEEEDFSDMYFLFSGEYLSDEEECLIEAEFSQKLDNLCVLPGMSSDFRYFLEDSGLNPEIVVEMECTCFGGELFTASVERKIYFPREFADNAELFLVISEETGAVSFVNESLERLKDACDEVF